MTDGLSKGLMVGTPFTRDPMVEFMGSVLMMEKPNPMVWDYTRNHPVDMARNLLIEKFRNYKLQYPELKYLLMVDSDATFHPHAAIRLMEWDVPVVTGCIYKRQLPPVPCIGPHVGVNKEGHHLYNFGWALEKIWEWCDAHEITATNTGNDLAGDVREVGDLVEIDGCGGHFLLIREDVIEQVRPPWFRRVGVGWNAAGEDFYFCRKVKAEGFKIYADLGVHTGHLAGAGFDVGLKELLSYRPLFIEGGTTEVWDVGG